MRNRLFTLAESLLYQTNVQSNLARGRIAVYRRMHSSAARTFSRVTIRRHIFPFKIAFSRWRSGFHLTHGFLAPHKSASQTVSRSVQPFLHSSPMCPRHYQIPARMQTTLRATVVAINCISCKADLAVNL